MNASPYTERRRKRLLKVEPLPLANEKEEIEITRITVGIRELRSTKVMGYFRNHEETVIITARVKPGQEVDSVSQALYKKVQAEIEQRHKAYFEGLEQEEEAARRGRYEDSDTGEW